MNWRVVEEGILDGNKKPHANTPFFKRAFPDPEKQHCRKHPRTSPVLPTHSHPTNSHPHTVPHHTNSQSFPRPALSLDVPARLFPTSCIFSGQHRKQRSHKSFLKVEWKRRRTGFGWHLQSLTAILRDLGSSVHSRDDGVASSSEMLKLLKPGEAHARVGSLPIPAGVGGEKYRGPRSQHLQYRILRAHSDTRTRKSKAWDMDGGLNMRDQEAGEASHPNRDPEGFLVKMSEDFHVVLPFLIPSPP